MQVFVRLKFVRLRLHKAGAQMCKELGSTRFTVWQFLPWDAGIFAVRQSNEWTSNTFCFGSVKCIFCSIESETRQKTFSLYCLYSKEEEGIQY